MNILKTPEDSTAFVRIMGEFDQFLSNNPKGRLTYEDYSSETRFKLGGSSSSSRVLSKSRSQGSLLTKEREKDVELIKSRSKIVQLESEMNSLESERKRARIEFEKDAGNQKLSFRRLEEKYDDLQQNFLCIAEQEKNAKDQLKEVKKEYEIFRNKSEQKLQNLQREKLKACAERDEIREDSSKKQMEMKSSLFRLETEKATMQTELEDTKSQLESFKRRRSELMSQLLELEQLREKSNTAEHRVKELEQKLARQEEATGVAMVMQTQLTKYRELQKENEKLKEDNHYYRYN